MGSARPSNWIIIINTHLNSPDEQTAKTSTFIEAAHC